MKKNIVGLLGLATLLLGYGTVSAQSIPTIGSSMTTTTIAQPYQQSQCVEPDGTIVYENRQFYFGDTYTTTDVVPKWGNGYDTLLLSATKVLVYNNSLFNFTSPIQWKSNGIPSNAPVNTAVVSQGTFVVNSTSPGQLVYNIHRTALENAGSSSYALTYLGRPNLVGYTAQLSNKTFHNQAGRVVNGYECVNYTVHYCGDGIVDTKQSIAGLPGGFANSIANEQCDGTAGVPAGYSCTSSCTLQQNIPTPTCSLTTSTPTITSGENAVLSASYTNASLAILTPTIMGLNFLYPNRSNTNIIVHPTATTTYTLTTLGIGGGVGALCSVTVNVKNTSVTLSKVLVNDVLYRSGDLVSFKINFANQGTTTVNNVVLTDNLPGGLDYVSSQMFGISSYVMGTGINGGTQFLQYSGFNLAPGQSGYFIITGKFKGYAYASQNINHVFLSADNIATLYANALFHTYIPSANATITKAADKFSYSLGENVKFVITVVNNGPDIIDNVQLIDTWPNNSCIVFDTTWTGSVPMTMTNASQPYTWNVNSSLSVGQTIYLYLLGHIANNPSCAGTHTNIVNLKYTVNGQIKTGQAYADIYIPLSGASCASMAGSTPTSNGNGYNVNLSCNGNNTTATTPIIIDCGNGTSIAGAGNSFNGVCSYASSFVGNAQCKVGNDTNNAACRVPISLGAGQCKSLDALDGNISLVDDNNDASSRFRCETVNNTVAQKLTIDCGDGNNYHTAYNVSSLESVCRYNNVDVPQTYTVRCLVNDVATPVCRQTIIIDDAGLGYCGDGFRQGYEDCDDGNLNGTSHSNCSKGCDLGGSMMACFNIGNTSISIQKGEILPFRWTLDFKDNIIPGNSCDGKRAGSVPEDSIYCTFDIYNGENTEADGDPVYSVRKRCNEDNRGNNVLFKYFLDKGWRSLTNSFGRYYLDSNDFVDNIFGEYKISLDKVEYQYCRDDDKTEGTEIDRVCSVDFAVTQPYLTQKSSFGLTPKSTSVPLEGYKMINGDELIDSTDLEDIMILKESDYAGGGNVATMMNAFINKYSKLAVKNGTLTSDEGNTITVYKVPGQDILVFKGAGTLTYTDTNKTKPFTVILDGPSIKINGSIEKTNSMFLLNKGDIIFSSADICSKTQVVKGIFVTNEGSFRAGADIANTNLNRPWCNFGGLKVQGILIGNGIEDLVSSRRSQLNGWFFVGGTSEAAIRAERRNEIFNGASVLIEYSPNLWNALPPGASEFTKALDVYKQ